MLYTNIPTVHNIMALITINEFKLESYAISHLIQNIFPSNLIVEINK